MKRERDTRLNDEDEDSDPRWHADHEGVIMDNFEMRVLSMVKTHFEMALRMAFDAAPGKKATHYRVTKKHGFIFCWHESEHKDVQPLPYEMGFAEAVPFAWGWLKKQDYGREPDHDGSNQKGFLIYNEDWGHVDGDSYAFIAIKPEWAMQGK